METERSGVEAGLALARPARRQRQICRPVFFSSTGAPSSSPSRSGALLFSSTGHPLASPNTRGRACSAPRGGEDARSPGRGLRRGGCVLAWVWPAPAKRLSRPCLRAWPAPARRSVVWKRAHRSGSGGEQRERAASAAPFPPPPPLFLLPSPCPRRRSPSPPPSRPAPSTALEIWVVCREDAYLPSLSPPMQNA